MNGPGAIDRNQPIAATGGMSSTAALQHGPQGGNPVPGLPMASLLVGGPNCVENFKIPSTPPNFEKTVNGLFCGLDVFLNDL